MSRRDDGAEPYERMSWMEMQRKTSKESYNLVSISCPKVQKWFERLVYPHFPTDNPENIPAATDLSRFSKNLFQLHTDFRQALDTTMKRALRAEETVELLKRFITNELGKEVPLTTAEPANLKFELSEEDKKNYVESAYGKCPHCGDVNITGESIDVDCNEARQEVSCSHCGAGWVDIYRLADIDPRNGPEQIYDDKTQQCFPAKVWPHYQSLIKILREEFKVEDNIEVYIHFWSQSDLGTAVRVTSDVRIAEINFSHGSGGSAYMQVDMDCGPLIFHCERYLLARVEDGFDDVELESTEYNLRTWIQREVADAEQMAKAKDESGEDE